MTALSDLCAVTFSAPSGLAAVSPVSASAAVPAVALQAAAHFSDGMPPRGLEALTPCPVALAEVLEAVGSAFEGAPRRTADAHPGTMRPVQSPAAEAPVVAGHASAPSAPRTESPSSLPAAGSQTAPVTEPAAQPVRVPSSAAGDALPSASGLAVTEGGGSPCCCGPCIRPVRASDVALLPAGCGIADRARDGDGGAAGARSDARGG